MEKNLTVMKFNDLDIKIYGTHEDPLFKANDIGGLLGIKNMHDAIKDFNIKQKSRLVLTDPHGRPQETNMLTEQGLYKVLMKSRKPIAEKFQDWVCEVIETIRKTGKYEIQQNLEKDKKLIREKTLIDSFHKKPVLYLGSVGNIDGLDLAKFGYTNDIKSRNTDHKREIGDCYVLEYVIECEQNIELERKLKDHNDIFNRRVTKTINGKVQTELIRLDEHLHMNDATKIVTKLKQTVRIDKEYQRMTHEETKMKHEEYMAKIEENLALTKLKQKELELKELELRIKIMELETMKHNMSNTPISTTESEQETLIQLEQSNETLATKAPLRPSNNKLSVPIETLKENITEYIEEQCDFEKRNTTYRMSSENMLYSFRNWRDNKYDVQNVVKTDFIDIINELTGNTTLPRVRINNNKVHGWYGIRYKAS